MTAAWLLLVAYAAGSIPFGLVIGKVFKGIDLRQVGSKNIGAANAFRNLGPGLGVLTLLMDAVKGALPVVLVGLEPFHVDPAQLAAWRVAVGLAAIMGHNYSLFLGFKGGKGIATSLGVVVALSWQAALCCLGVYAVVMAATRYASVASLSGATALPFAMYFISRSPVYVGFALVAMIFAFYKHRSNLRNLMEGKEPRLAPPRRPAATGQGIERD
ncbi:MAG: glycerol-3-phosphate 1-O-acyltransferase PlsY [Candidatus Xenobia bacterium]